MIRFIRVMLIFLACFLIWIIQLKHIDFHEFFIPKRTVHVFVDEASFAAFQQMIFLLQLPQEDIKVIWWERYYPQSKKFGEFQKNVIVPINRVALTKQIQILANQDDMVFEFHMNMKHIGKTGLLLVTEVPPEKVKKIHLYEDSASHIYRKQYSLSAEKDKPFYIRKLQTAIQEKNVPYYFPYMNILPVFYPVVIHTTYLDKLREEPGFQILFKIPNITWEKFDTPDAAKTVPGKIKKQLFAVFDFDINQIRQQLKTHPMGVLMMSTPANKIQPQFDKLMEIVQNNTKINGTVWFVKNHPTLGNGVPAPDMHFISNRIPFELLVLAQLPIKYIAGEGTSAFLSAENVSIIAYIPHRNYYVDVLKKFGLLDEQVIIQE